MQPISWRMIKGILCLFLITASGCQPVQPQATAVPPISSLDCGECGFSPVGPKRTPLFQEKISGCAAKNSQQSRSAGPGTETSPAISLEGATLTYTRAVNHNCCTLPVTTAQVKLGRIVFTENWQGKSCRCVCFSEINDSLSGLEPGSYQIEVVQKGDPDALQPDQEITLLSSSMEVK